MLRYFIRGLTDGSLSTLGIAIGASAAQPLIIISAALGGAIANGFSNVLAAFSAEYAIRYKEFRELEEHMVTKLKGTEIEKLAKKEVRISCLLDGGSTIVGGIIPIIPFIFFTPMFALGISIAAVLILMLFLGVFVGKLSKENLLLSASKMVIFTIVTAVVIILILRLI